MSGPSIEFVNVSRRFGEGYAMVTALKDVTLSLDHGSRVAVTGPSGSGKTTLLNLVGALDRPSSGFVRVMGQEVSAFSEQDASTFRRHHVGFVFQDDALIPELTVRENVELPLVLLGEPSKSRRHRVETVISQLGLDRRIDSFPPLLSGGEKQRAAVARAVIHGPQILLADEPTANLDTKSADAVMQTIDDLAAENELTVIVSTHDLRIAGRFDLRIRLNDGQLEPNANVSA
jgi:putative ABC transport system ATP-binding protein